MSGNVHANRSTDPLTCIQHRVLKLERFEVDNYKFKIPSIVISFWMTYVHALDTGSRLLSSSVDQICQ